MTNPDWEGFGKQIIKMWDWEYDAEAWEIQEQAAKFGILKPVEVTEPCQSEDSDQSCTCAEMDNIPGTCYRRNYQ